MKEVRNKILNHETYLGTAYLRYVHQPTRTEGEYFKVQVRVVSGLNSSSFLLRVTPWLIILILFIISTLVAHAQTKYSSAYLVPQTVYVGDRATLVLPLSALAAEGEFSLGSESPVFPSLADVEFHRVALERRPSGSRLTIEFSAYAPGVFELPSFEIGGEVFSGIKFEISSILNGADAILCGPLPPAPVPGTGLLVYGTLSCVVLLLLFVLWVAIWGRQNIAGWFSMYRRRRLIASLLGVERHLQKSLLKGMDKREILDVLSTQFRAFLSLLTGENCRAMTAREFRQLVKIPIKVSDKDENLDEMQAVLDGGFLESFFKRCDNLRFAGAGISGRGVSALLGDLCGFIERLSHALRKRRGKGETQ